MGICATERNFERGSQFRFNGWKCGRVEANFGPGFFNDMNHMGILEVFFLSVYFRGWINPNLDLTDLDHPKVDLQCQIQMIDPTDIKKSYCSIISHSQLY